MWIYIILLYIDVVLNYYLVYLELKNSIFTLQITVQMWIVCQRNRSPRFPWPLTTPTTRFACVWCAPGPRPVYRIVSAGAPSPWQEVPTTLDSWNCSGKPCIRDSSYEDHRSIETWMNRETSMKEWYSNGV